MRAPSMRLRSFNSRPATWQQKAKPDLKKTSSAELSFLSA
jgi:hypothetical protein